MHYVKQARKNGGIKKSAALRNLLKICTKTMYLIEMRFNDESGGTHPGPANGVA